MVEDNVVLEFDLDGFTEDDLKVDVSDDSISISAENKVEKKSEREGYHGYEKNQKTFSYFSSLPPVNSDKAEVNFSNGKLRVVIPKKNNDFAV